MTSTLKLYYRTEIEPDKNIVVEDIEDYLSTITSTTIEDFQYIKHNLDIVIKINESQEKLEYFYNNNINYCSIQNENGKIVYYFVINKNWKGQNTIELTLRMDSANTFKFNLDYNLTRKTLVKREHKDRYDKRNQRYIHTEKNIQVIGNQDFFQYTITIDNAVSIGDVFIESFTQTSGTGKALPEIYEIRKVNNEVTISLQFVGFSGGYVPPLYFDVSFSIDYYGYVRKIDKIAEGFNPMLYKKDINYLYDADADSNWYMIFRNAYEIEDATEKKVNPVQLLFVKDAPYKIVAGTRIYPVRYYATAIPKISDTREHVIFRYKDLTAEQIAAGNTTITINGNVYTLCPYEDSDPATNKCPMIVYTRYNNNDVVGTIHLCYKSSILPSGFIDERITDVPYIEVYNYTTAHVSTFTPIIGGGDIDILGFWENTSFTTITEINSGINTENLISTSIGEINLTDPQIIKIIACPYAPLKDFVGMNDSVVIPSFLIWNVGFKALEMKDTRKMLLSYSKTFNVSPFKELVYTPALNFNATRHIDNESKLFHSEFYYRKFVYAESSFPFSLELINPNDYMDYNVFEVSYSTSRNVASKFMFIFTQYTCDEYDTADWNNVLQISRNNEIALYNNSYINYLRTGYAYDTENKNKDTAMKGLSIGLSAVGTIASFLSAPFTGGLSIAGGIGMATSTIGQIANAIHSVNQQERNIAQQRINLSNQATNITSEDIDLLEIMSGNKAKIVEYKTSEVVRQYLFDLFHYCGYACNEYKIPSINTRYWFNFVQADIKFEADNNIPEHIKIDIANRFNNGITFLHHRDGWDFTQQKENIELSLLGGNL